MSDSKKNTDNPLYAEYEKKAREMLVVKELNERLLDANHNLLARQIQFCKKYGIPIEHETRALLAEVRKALYNIHQPPCNNHDEQPDSQQK